VPWQTSEPPPSAASLARLGVVLLLMVEDLDWDTGACDDVCCDEERKDAEVGRRRLRRRCCVEGEETYAL
jgi:hypothetical protein